MTIELPVFRLGLAGFSADQREELAAAVRAVPTAATVWEIGELDGADAWWINGARVQMLDAERVRVGAGTPSERSLRLHLPDVDRPLAFAQPLPSLGFQGTYSFDSASQASVLAVLERFDAWLAPVTAQFCLASHIVEHERALGSGVFELSAGGQLLALVDMQGEAAVLPIAGPADFEEAVWRRRSEPQACMPEQFVRTSLAQLMWQYALRTDRDLLPKHYRTGPVFFRRPPRVPQRMLQDTHLLLMRELTGAASSFDALREQTGLDECTLARHLAALYFVGSITSNPKRAVAHQRACRAEGPESTPSVPSSMPSMLDSVPPSTGGRRAPALGDFTAPASLRFD